MNSDIERIISRWSDEYRRQAAPLIAKIKELLEYGLSPQEAVNLALLTTGFSGAVGEELKRSMGLAAASGYGSSVSADTAMTLGEKLSLMPWAADKLVLSSKLYGLDLAMRQTISGTIADQIRNGTNWVQMSRALYDGYGFPEKIQRAELPEYLKALVSAAQRANPNDPATIAEVKRLARIANRNIDRMAQDGAPNRMLKAAYRQLAEIAEKGSAKALAKAVDVAVNEKSRYLAERIARTEGARAWSEGFWAQNYSDPDVVGVRWRLSSRHPKFDICDFHATANMYGLGPGVYPKGKNPPHPAHPHCTCRLVPVFDGEVGAARARVQKGGNEFLRSLTAKQRQDLLGAKGVKDWQAGADWSGSLRNWQGHVDPRPRLSSEDFNHV